MLKPPCERTQEPPSQPNSCTLAKQYKLRWMPSSQIQDRFDAGLSSESILLLIQYQHLTLNALISHQLPRTTKQCPPHSIKHLSCILLSSLNPARSHYTKLFLPICSSFTNTHTIQLFLPIFTEKRRLEFESISFLSFNKHHCT